MNKQSDSRGIVTDTAANGVNVLIVYAHPEPTSFASALKNVAVRALTAAGHRVEVSDPLRRSLQPGGRATRFHAAFDVDESRWEFRDQCELTFAELMARASSRPQVFRPTPKIIPLEAFMGHDIDCSTGKPAIAYVGETPWHGLGERLPERQPIEVWIKAARLDWELKRLPVQFFIDSKLRVMDDRFVLARSDTGVALSVVSGDYHIVQPKEVLEFYRDLVASFH
jgi:hypothetical protein